MSPLTELLVAVAILSGAVLLLLAALGAVRLPETMARMHAAAKAPAIGLLLLLSGAAVLAPGRRASVVLVLAAVLQLVVSPLAAHLLARAARRHDSIEGTVTPPIDVERRTRP
ncbi:MAG: monovalent cation/H(+) antiporter subunit G [Actinomycetes bacterium]